MVAWPAITLLVLLPAFGAGFLLPVSGTPSEMCKNARLVALWTSVATFLLLAFLLFTMHAGPGSVAMDERFPWLSFMGGNWHMGADFLSAGFALVVCAVWVVAFLSAMALEPDMGRREFAALLLLQSFLLVTLFSRNVFLFCFFFLASIVPPFILLASSPSLRDRRAGFRGFWFPFLAFVPMLVLVTSETRSFFSGGLGYPGGNGLMLAMLAAFGARMFLWPLHASLREALRRGGPALVMTLPVAGMVAGLYGMTRFVPGMMESASFPLRAALGGWGAFAIFLAGMMAVGAEDRRARYAGVFMVMTGYAAFPLLCGVSVGVLDILLLAGGIALAWSGLVIAPAAERTWSFFAAAMLLLPGTAGFSGGVSLLYAVSGISIWCALPMLAGLLMGGCALIGLSGAGDMPPWKQHVATVRAINAILAGLAILLVACGMFAGGVYLAAS